MKISLDWLSDYVEIDQSAEKIAEILSNLGFPTEGIEYLDGDTVIDLEVTSNRGDCLSHIGIGRELAAATGKKLKLPEIILPESKKDISEFAEVRIEDADLCARYTARVICGVKIGSAPEWMAKRLEAVGVRSVNNVVDATNYAMMESGQPPHAFDYGKLSGAKIIVRRALKGERLISIDETKCDLDPDMQIIAEGKKPIAIAGVMGGLETEINEATTTILLEDAQFNPVSVRSTGRKLGIKSGASFRFERYVDTENIDWASQRTVQLIVEVAGGTVAKGLVDVYPGRCEQKGVSVRISRLNKLLGIEVSKDQVIRILAGLGFNPQAENDDTVCCTVPTWRHDISREADLIEEVARSYGYDKIPIESKINIEVVPVENREKIASKLRTFLNGCGFYETINVTFVERDVAELFSADAQAHIGVKDESRKSANLLRGSLLGSLLEILKSNYNTGNIPCRIFELADTFKTATEKSNSPLPEEKTKLGLVLDGDFRELRGIIDGLMSTVNKELQVELKPVDLCWATAGARIIADGTVIGSCGIVSQEVAEKFGLSEIQASAAELDFESLMSKQGQVISVKPLPRFPSSTRDLSLIVGEEIKWADILGAVKTKAPAELEDVHFEGIYRGKPIPNDKKSVTISLRFRDEDGTLTHEDVDSFESVILGELKDKLKAQLRTA